MRVTPVEHGLDLLASDLIRSPGLHASTIYGDLFKEIDPSRYGRGGPDPVRMCLGTAWEVHLERLLTRAGVQAVRPGEFRSAGGGLWALSPDLVLFNGHDSIGEIKLTWMSSRDVPRVRSNGFPARFDKYILQIQDGCNAIETSHARLYVYFVNGTNKPPKPELMCWDIEFTARELKEGFDTMLNHARSKGML